MKTRVLVVFFFFLYLWLVVRGAAVTSSYTAPYLILTASLSIAGLYFYTIIADSHSRAPERVQLTSPVHIILLSAAAILLCISFYLLSRVFSANADVHTWSDVIPQLTTLYDRFARGEQPYYPLAEYAHHPFPVYLPLHWLPVGLARWTGSDPRIVGLLMLYIVVFAFVILTVRSGAGIWAGAFVSIVPPGILLAFAARSALDVSLNLETIIAAYYLILAIGLWQRNIAVTTAGIILCILSRYTLVFWLPLFAIIMGTYLPRRHSLIVWGSVAAAVILIYIMPFCLRAPAIFLDGLRYHNAAAEADWEYGGTFNNGLYFALHLRDLFAGTIAERFFLCRIVQGGLMLSLLAGGLLTYYKVRQRPDPFDFSLGMLYLTLLLFYLFGPLTYAYYLIPLFFISSVLCIRVLGQATHIRG